MMNDMQFVKYKIKLERVDSTPGKRKEWKEINSKTGEYGYTPEIDVTEYVTTDVLQMEWREEIDLRDVVAAILKMPRGPR